MIAFPHTRLAAMASTLLVLVLLTGLSSAFVPSSMLRNNAVSSSTSVGMGGIFDFLNEGKKNLVKSMAGDYDAAAIQARTDSLIQDNPVLVMSFTTCPFCVKAKEILDETNAKYTVVELDTDPDGKAIRAELGDLIGRTSVPAIWIGQEFIGGCNDGPLGGVSKLRDTGKLTGMLQEVGAI
mmetsp:Transcript_9783/g.13793  ORF Transcript_9783/g.13793 Transcript_9783/m.13793 type:complete len:181 (+) Transcript_9783:130-672(+)